MDDSAVSKQKELEAASQRINELEQIITRLYDDSTLGRLSFERYSVMSKGYLEEQKQLKADVAVLEEALYGKRQAPAGMKQFAELVEQYTDITEVTLELLHTLIDRIVIHEEEMDGDEIIMRVDVHYCFIGYVGDKTGADMRAPQIRRSRWGKKAELVQEIPETAESDENQGK